ncbi:MAG: SprT family zinc-dependent metalloprotease [Sphingomonadales bacterium]|nr:SprT family zinc-dependent metalloprotease [Sphingomonadales bacterium]
MSFDMKRSPSYRNQALLFPLIHRLRPFMNEDAATWAAQLLIVHGVELQITKERSSKYADYRPPWRGKGHVITLNHNLRPLSFLLIFLHEYAHLLNWVDYGSKVAIHGNEWASTYASLVNSAIQRGFFPVAMHGPLRNAMRHPQASGCAQTELLEWLRKYEGQDKGWFTLDQLAEGVRFRTKAGMTFIKGPKGRTRFRCLRIPGRDTYLIHQSLMVMPLHC